jgi:hypothetical protein
MVSPNPSLQSEWIIQQQEPEFQPVPEFLLQVQTLPEQ